MTHTSGSKRRASRVAKLLASAAALAVVGVSGSANAGGTSAPGYTTGVPVFATLPEGLFYLNQTLSNFHDVNGVDIRANFNVFLFYYQTGVKFLGADLSFIVAPIAADVFVEGLGNDTAFYNTYGAAQLSWEIAPSLFLGYRLGTYVKQDSKIALDYWTIEQRAGLSYVGDGWNLTANFIYGTPVGEKRFDPAPDYGILDLTATKKFGKFEIGAVAHTSRDLSSAFSGYQKQSQTAIGGLIGYDFGGANLQVKLTRDVASKNYGFKDTVIWTNLAIPLWVAPAATPSAPLVTKY